MKKIVVMSDNHGQHEMIKMIRNQESDADFFVHCGDTEAKSDILKGWIAVKGNNDWMSDLNEEEIFNVDETGVFVCHGHRLPFFDRDEVIIEILRKTKCQILLCGHTHVPEHTIIDGYHIINPGSTSLPRRGSAKGYCVIYVDNGNIEVEFKEI
ncbi:MAG: metallophosphoesterase family protein [Coprobacillaceae bacterium]